MQNGDDAPLPITAVQLEMAQRELCFRGGGSGYRLYLGDPALQAPVYDYGLLFHSVADAAHVAAGAAAPNPQYVPRPDARPFTERHPALLWLGLTVAIAVLGGVAFRTRGVA